MVPHKTLPQRSWNLQHSFLENFSCKWFDMILFFSLTQYTKKFFVVRIILLILYLSEMKKLHIWICVIHSMVSPPQVPPGCITNLHNALRWWILHLAHWHSCKICKKKPCMKRTPIGYTYYKLNSVNSSFQGILCALNWLWFWLFWMKAYD